MPIDKTIWTELWARALREPIGLLIRTSNPDQARWFLHQARPTGCKNWTIARTDDPQLLLLVGPDVDPRREQNLAVHAQINSDLEDQQEPLT